MSAKVECKADVRNITILTETLRELNIAFEEASGEVIVSRRFNNIIFDFNKKENNISHDSDDRSFLEKVLKNYQKNVAFNKAIKEGHTIKSCVEENGEIIIRCVVN